jgi:hypothetical protein
MVRKNLKKCFKIVWLPTSFTKIEEVAKKLCSNIGKILSIKKVVDKDGIAMNIFNITIEYPENHNIDFSNLTGKKELYGEKMFITCYGDPIRCIYCSEFGHKKAECSKFNSICSDCRKRGHLKCTMATKLNSNEEEIDHEDEDVENIMKGEIELEVENNTVNTCKPTSTFPTAQAIIKAVTIKTNDKNTPSVPKANEINANNQSHENQAKNKKKNKKKEEKQNKEKENKRVTTTSISQKQTNNEQVSTSSKKRNLASPESNEKSKKQHNNSDHSIIEYSDEDNENDEENMDEQNSSR